MDLSADGRELDGVRYEARNDLAQAAGVAEHIARRSGKIRRDVDVFGPRRRARGVKRDAADGRKFHCARLDLESGRAHAFQIKQVIHDPKLSFAAALNARGDGLDFSIVAAFDSEEAIPAEHRVQWRAQFVRDEG